IEFADAVNVESALRAKYGTIAKELDQYSNSLLDYAEKSGLLSSKSVKLIRSKNLMYAPFYRDVEKPSRGIRSGQQAVQPIKRMKGSTIDIIPLLEGFIKNTEAIIINSEKNLTGKTFGEFSKRKSAGRYIERVPIPTQLKSKTHEEEIRKATEKHLQETGQMQFLDREGNLLPEYEDFFPDLI